MDLLVASECLSSACVSLAHSTDPDFDFVGRECVSDHGKAACADLGGVCRTERDGYYWVSTLCIATGAMVLLFFVQPAARKLQCTPLSHSLGAFEEADDRLFCYAALPNSAWRVMKKSSA